jgi:hypothetical protein
MLIKGNSSGLPTKTLMQNANRFFIPSVVLFSVSLGWTQVGTDRSNAPDLWELAQREKSTHRFSTLFTAQDVRDRLSKDSGIDKAIAWCKRTGVTRVFIEEYRDGYQADQPAIIHARDRFLKEGFDVSGCVTTTQVGKSSTGWKNVISCYTNPQTQLKLKTIFGYAAGLFDEIMIDDFWFTDCVCSECEGARKTRTVTIGDKTYPVPGDSWEDYRSELMVHLSQDYVLGAARRRNPKVKLIIKYPQWYDQFHARGYEIVRETVDFDRIWVGTETRDYTNKQWGGTVQYEGYFIMRWLGGLGGEKCGGGWYDWLGTTERTYIEQARQTVLAGAHESLLFCYGGLQGSTGPKNVQALRADVPELIDVAREVRTREIVGIAAYKPPNSHPEKEAYIFDFVGMLGLPLVPCHEFPANAPAAFFSMHALKDVDIASKLAAFIASGKPVLLTDGLAQQLAGKVTLEARNVQVLPVKGDPQSLLRLSQKELDDLRAPLLQPLKTGFDAPNRVSLYLFKEGSWVVENFNDQAVQVNLNGEPFTVDARSWLYRWK